MEEYIQLLLTFSWNSMQNMTYQPEIITNANSHLLI